LRHVSEEEEEHGNENQAVYPKKYLHHITCPSELKIIQSLVVAPAQESDKQPVIFQIIAQKQGWTPHLNIYLGVQLFQTAERPDAQSRPNEDHHYQYSEECEVERLVHFVVERSRTAAERSEVGWSDWFGSLEVAEFILKRE